MPVKKTKIENSRFAMQFLIEANITGRQGLSEAPVDFTTRHMKLIDSLKLKTPAEVKVLMTNSQPFDANKSRQEMKRKWKHGSVLQLIKESRNPDPISEIKARARRVVLHALSNGWNGPPFDAISLAKILKYDIAPNDGIADARTISLGTNKFRIEYNPFQKPTRLNFSIGHEIVHTFFSDCHEKIRNREEDPDINRQLEQLCNIGAAELQLPYVVFPDDANATEEITIDHLLALAKKYKSSLESLLLSFTEVVDRPCAIIISSFLEDQTIVVDYYKSSSSFDLNIPDNFIIPKDSRAYYCTSPGWTERETEQWSFMDRPYNMFFIGISPMRKERRARIAIIVVPSTSREKLQQKRIQIEFGDATKPRGKGIKIIAQVVNTSGALGIGFGKSLSKNYPEVKAKLKSWKEEKNDFRLGKCQLLKVKDDIYVFQMLAQQGLYIKDGKIPLDYEALRVCLTELKDIAKQLGGDVYMPLIGAGQAKGKWEIIEGLIYSELVNQNVKVTIYLFGAPNPEEFKPRPTLSLFNEKSTWEKEK